MFLSKELPGNLLSPLPCSLSIPVVLLYSKFQLKSRLVSTTNARGRWYQWKAPAQPSSSGYFIHYKRHLYIINSWIRKGYVQRISRGNRWNSGIRGAIMYTIPFLLHQAEPHYVGHIPNPPPVIGQGVAWWQGSWLVLFISYFLLVSPISIVSVLILCS